MTHEYKKALKPIEYEIEMRKLRGFEQTPLSDKELETIRKALELAIALQPIPFCFFKHYSHLSSHNFILYSREENRRISWIDFSKPTHFYDISALPKPEAGND